METAILAGFSFHHVEHGNLVLSKWLPKDLPNKLPEGATHQVQQEQKPCFSSMESSSPQLLRVFAALQCFKPSSSLR